MRFTSAAANALQTSGNARLRYPPPPVPLVVPEPKVLKKSDMLKVDLKTHPEDPTSTDTYSISVRFFDHGTPQEWIDFLKSFRQVITGQNMVEGSAKFAMARVLLKGDALRVFNSAAVTLQTETSSHFTSCINDVAKHVFPEGALKRQKRYMVRYMRKPRDTKVRDMTARVVEMNQDLKFYPPFDASKRLDDSELADIIEFGLPREWQKILLVQGFDIMDHSLDELTDIAERLEVAEEIYEAQTKPKLNEQKAKPGAKRGYEKRTYGPSKSPFDDSSRFRNDKRPMNDHWWCPYHHTSKHDMNKCKLLLVQAKQMSAAN